MSTSHSDRRIPILAVRSRRTIRFRLTAIYASLFLISGALLLTIGYHFVTDVLPAPDPHHMGPADKAANEVFAARRHITLATLLSEQGRWRAHALHKLLAENIALLAGLSLLSVALGWLTATRALRPLRRITNTTKNISARNLNERLDLEGPDDELKELSATIDELLARLERSFQSQRRFVANASHELRTPLALEQALLEAALTEPHPTATSWRTTCERALASSKHQTRLLEALLALARSERALDRNEPIDLAVMASRVLDAHQAEAQRQHIKITAQLDPAPVTGDPRLIERLIDNLTDNALSHNQHHGSVQITTTTVDSRAVLSIINTGPDVRAADISRLLQPFQRYGADRTNHTGGLGLGLSIVHAITSAHNAQLDIHPRQRGGLAIEVRFAPQVALDQAKTGHASSQREECPSLPRPRSDSRSAASTAVRTANMAASEASGPRAAIQESPALR
ncbi:MAG: HAMP domain-containing histidine kinase [Solirubrobacterales bacterium]|nr:HAMP domain-containing histidine kinase [Solirubrobacterales bacterium]